VCVATSADMPMPAPADDRRRFDVVIVGVGARGLTVARPLAADGRSVAVLEAGPGAAGATGYTTAKVTAPQATVVSDIVSRLAATRRCLRRRHRHGRWQYLPDQLSTPVAGCCRPPVGSGSPPEPSQPDRR
jgi:glycine/D-amino acid oxidase-like deaminating enzyme